MKQYIVDAFTDHIFAGNPAAVCLPEEELAEPLMLAIARENKLSETAFAVKTGEHYHLRWFTPGGEIDLCGHATLATAFVIVTEAEPDRTEVSFETLSGVLTVKRRDGLLEMDFPAYALQPVPVTEEMEQALGAEVKEAYLGRDLLCVLPDAETVRTLRPDMEKLEFLPGLLQHVTAAGEEHDCVSRSFGPKVKIPEDPVCGSGHCHIVPYWSRTLRKQELTAYQASSRGGTLYCRIEGDRIRLAGKAVLFSRGELFTDGVTAL